MISIIDYGMGNLKSVAKAFRKLGIKASITSSPADIENAAGIVLPGVGAFRDCMANLDSNGLAEPIIRSVEKGKPYLGICLGLQVLFTESEEFGASRGLGILRGRVVRFRTDGLKIPHMGWNTVMLKRRPPIFNGIGDNSYFYFVHSYYVVPEEGSIVAGTTHYGTEFTSMVWKDNIMATQFHPEKSQQLGLRILERFGSLVEKGK